MGMAEQYPSPRLYGAWAARLARKREPEKAAADLTAMMHRHHARPKEEELMKRPKTHTGTFHCPSCFIELELVNEESLKCDKCKGPLAQGSLDDLFVDEDDEDD